MIFVVVSSSALLVVNGSFSKMLQSSKILTQVPSSKN